MDLIAHPATEKNIKAFIARPSHGLLLVGTKGSGKGYVAKYIVSEILGKAQGDIAKHPYFKILDSSAESPAGIDDIRELKSFLGLRTTGRSPLRRFVIIKNAEYLGHEAQNAMLKLLEEPPEDTCIILTSSEPTKIKRTIRSRLQTIRIRHLSKSQISELTNDPADIERLYAISEGAVALLVTLTDKTKEPDNRYLDDAKDIISSGRLERLAKVDALSKDKEYSVSELLSALYKIMNIKFKSAAEQNDRKLGLLLYKKMKLALHAQRMLGQRVQPKLVLTQLFYEL